MNSRHSRNISGSTYSRFDWLDNHNAIKSRMRSDIIGDLPIFPADQILDIGCGVGYWSLLAAGRVGVRGRILGIDPDLESIRLAESRCRTSVLAPIVEFRCSDVEHLAVEPSSIDVIFMFNVLSYVRDPLACVRHVLPMLRPSGRLLIKDCDLQSDFFHPVPLDLYSEVTKAALGGPHPAVVGNFDPFFARRIPGLLREVSGLRTISRSYSFSVFHPPLPQERHFIGANAAMLSDIAARNGAPEKAKAWTELFDESNSKNIFGDEDFMYSMNEFVFQVTKQ